MHTVRTGERSRWILRSGVAIAGALFVVVVFASCGDDGEPGSGLGFPGPPGTVVAGGRDRVALERATGTIFLQRNGVTLVTLPLASWALGKVSVLEEEYNYDPYPLYRPNSLYVPADGLEWIRPMSFSLKTVSPHGWTLELTYPEGPLATLEVRQVTPRRFEFFWQPVDATSIAYFRLRIPVAPSEAFYGLGEYYDDVNHRGKLRAMQIELDPEIESRYNEAHVPIPLLLSSIGWGLFVESDFPAVFDVAHSDPSAVETTWGTGTNSNSGLRLHWFVEDHPLDLTRHYYEITGNFRIPPPWVYGPLVWRDENRDQEEFESDLRTMRDLDLAASGVWIDRPYATAVNSFDFDPLKFPEPQRMFALARELGYAVSLWHTPYLDRRHPVTRSLRSSAREQGFLPPRVGLLLNDWSEPLDFTNPAAVHWWQELLRPYVEEYGVRGFKLDYGEDVVPGVSSARNRWMFFDGSDERTMHSRYQQFYHATYAGVLPSEGGLLLVRHAVFGDQVHGVVVWPGDLDATFARHRELVQEAGRSYIAVGGLPAAVVAGLNLGPSGFPLYGSDTGGYRHGPPDKELFTRWFQQTALSTVMQVGTGTNDVAWEPRPANGFDAEMLGWYRDYTRLHLRLFPYVWSAVHEVRTTGRAVQRPLGLAYPELGEHPWDQYLLGEDLLVAPVLRRGERAREVLFPPGVWVHWWDGSSWQGPARSMVSAPLPELPLFLRQGAVIPLLRPTVDTLYPAGSAAVDSFADDPGVLFVRCVPGPARSVRLFDGARIGQRTVHRGPHTAVVEIESRPGATFRSGAVFELFGLPPGSRIVAVTDRNDWPELPSIEALERAPRGFFSGEGALWVKTPPEGSKASVFVSLGVSRKSDDVDVFGPE